MTIDTRRYSPLVNELKQIMKESGRTSLNIAEESGVSSGTLSAWFHRLNPSLPNFESVLRELGHSLKIEKNET